MSKQTRSFHEEVLVTPVPWLFCTVQDRAICSSGAGGIPAVKLVVINVGCSKYQSLEYKRYRFRWILFW